MWMKLGGHFPRDGVAGLTRRFATDASGASAIEYAVMTFIFIAIIVAVSQLGETVTDLYQSAADAFTN
jgi:Flp pilus assembly pilin Flp